MFGNTLCTQWEKQDYKYPKLEMYYLNQSQQTSLRYIYVLTVMEKQ